METSMSGIFMGRCERAVRAYLTNGILDTVDFNILRDCLEQVGRRKIFIRSFFGLLIPVLQRLLDCSCLQITVTDSGECCTRDFASRSRHYFAS